MHVSISLWVWLGLIFSHPISWVLNIFGLQLHLLFVYCCKILNTPEAALLCPHDLSSALPSTGVKIWNPFQAGSDMIGAILHFLWKLKFQLSPLCYLCTIVTHCSLVSILLFFISREKSSGIITMKYVTTVFLRIALISALIILHLICWLRAWNYWIIHFWQLSRVMVYLIFMAHPRPPHVHRKCICIWCS
jgi:hypothetical protein